MCSDLVDHGPWALVCESHVLHERSELLVGWLLGVEFHPVGEAQVHLHGRQTWVSILEEVWTWFYDIHIVSTDVF